MNKEKIALANKIARAEDRLEQLKSEYILKYGYNRLTIDTNGDVHETPGDDL